MNRSLYGIVFMSLLVASMLLSSRAGAVTSTGLPTIISVSRTPDVPNYYQSVVVSALVESADQCLLFYTSDGVDWKPLDMDQAGNVFSATIPALPYGTTVQYSVSAFNGTLPNWVQSETYSYTVSNASAQSPSAFSVSITPHYVVLIGGQSQLFNSTVTGGSPPYTYKWVLGISPIPGATGPTYNYTAYSGPGADYIFLYVTDSAGITEGAFAIVWVSMLDAAVYYSVEPVSTAPLTNLNASINGLETPSAPSSVGENFTVEIHLRNATAMNVPAGVGGVEVHFYFGNILDYCKPIGFTDELGQTGGALAEPCIYAFKGFYDDNWAPVPTPPYTNATTYIVAAGSETGPWNGNDGLVAKITFQIIRQPSENMSQPDFYGQLVIGFADIEDWNVNEIPFSVSQGTLQIDKAPLFSLAGDLNGDGKVSLVDLILLANAYGSKPRDPNWNPLADIAPPFGIISLTDLVTLAMHYGQHNP